MPRCCVLAPLGPLATRRLGQGLSPSPVWVSLSEEGWYLPKCRYLPKTRVPKCRYLPKTENPGPEVQVSMQVLILTLCSHK